MRRSLSASTLLLCILAFGSRAQAPDRAKEIADLEKRIADLNLRLAELKKPAPEKPGPPLPDSWTKSLSWRCVGPASMGGRIVSLAVCPTDPSTWWVATASGGLLKTTNNGNTFEHQFDMEATVSIGDVAVAPSNKDIVWVGTGENNPRNSASWGDGVYKSTDGGKKWANMGLRKSFQTGKILIHPTNPDIVYVGALGRLWGPNEERGLYKTEDGGKTWKKVLHIDDDTGVIDMRMHPAQPDTLIVATWERRRDGFDSHAGALAGAFDPTVTVEPPLEDGYDAYDPIRKWGKGSGLHKTTDGGKTWKKLTKGLPSGKMGRIGLDWHAKDPNVLFAIIDCDRIGMGRVSGLLGVTFGPEATIATVGEGTPAAKAGLKKGDQVKAVNGKAIAKSDEAVAALGALKPGDKAALDLVRDGKPMKVEAVMAERTVEGAAPRIDFRGDDGKDGVTITALLPRGPLSKARLEKGDVVTLADGKPVKTFKELSDLLRASGPEGKVKLSYLRGKEKKEGIWSATGRRPSTRPFMIFLGGQRENAQDQQGPDAHEYGGLYRSGDGGESWQRINSINPRPMYFSQVRVDPSDEKRLYVLGIRLHISEDGGKTFRENGRRIVHDDGHAMWIDPRDGRHLIYGTDGGTYVTHDRGAKWDYLNTKALGQFYSCCVDDRKPYRVYGGLQDNGSWGGPSRSLDGKGPVNSDWRMVLGGDGFVCAVDPQDPDTVYAESQDGNMARVDMRTWQQTGIRPVAREGDGVFRFNWNTPFAVSKHNPRVVYSVGSRVFRSLKRGDGARPISAELCKSNQASGSAFAESPRNADVLWAGTDDGQVWVTRDGGAKWENVAPKLKLPKGFCCSTLEASRVADGRAYACFDGHRSDDDEPWVFVTEDFGQTWKSLRGNLPAGSTRCLREDAVNPDVLYLGTEFAVWASIDRGTNWTRINANLPTVAVHELAQNPASGELVAATHGRSLWILDISPLRHLKPGTAKAAATLLEPNAATRWRTEPPRRTIYGYGDREFFGENPAPGAHLWYVLGKKAEKASLVVQDVAGRPVATLPASTQPGLHKATWNMRGVAATGNPFTLGGLLSAAQRSQLPAPAGTYRVVLKVDGVEMVQPLKLENDPTLPATVQATELMAELEE
ncbi:MAG: PDZ domain-containing protein [Gemmataceae bacterium]|nr:PDZ domain-containing protein [Gemmataceae bacterium]